MKKLISLVIIVLIIAGLILFRGLENSSQKTTIGTMKITSSVFINNGQIPQLYTCNGKNINPPLQFSDIPENTKSLVLIVDDPDAPGGTWVHWVIFNMPPNQTEIKENTQPEGTEGTTSFGKPGYGGPCPPSGTHHYHFKLYALDSMLSLDERADKNAVEQAMQNHIINSGELVGLYQQKKISVYRR